MKRSDMWQCPSCQKRVVIPCQCDGHYRLVCDCESDKARQQKMYTGEAPDEPTQR